MHQKPKNLGTHKTRIRHENIFSFDFRSLTEYEEENMFLLLNSCDYAGVNFFSSTYGIVRTFVSFLTENAGKAW